MSLKLDEVACDEDFDEIWPVLFEAYADPFNAVSEFFNPNQGSREKTIQVSKERHLQWWHNSPSTHWLKVTDKNTMAIVAAACWQIHTTTAEPTQQPFDAYWHPAGSEERKFVSKWLGGVKKLVAQRMSGPHLELLQIVTHPLHRRRGAASMLVQWGLNIAEDLGLETCVVSRPSSCFLYEKKGFISTDKIEIDMTVPEPSEKWRELEGLDIHTYFMWRPKTERSSQGGPGLSRGQSS